jgi:hypothetical protein
LKKKTRERSRRERDPSSYAAFFSYPERRNNKNKPVCRWIGAAAQSSKEKEEIGWVFVWRKKAKRRDE